jgi:hypothetical protein
MKAVTGGAVGQMTWLSQHQHNETTGCVPLTILALLLTFLLLLLSLLVASGTHSFAWWAQQQQRCRTGH